MSRNFLFFTLSKIFVAQFIPPRLIRCRSIQSPPVRIQGHIRVHVTNFAHLRFCVRVCACASVSERVHRRCAGLCACARVYGQACVQRARKRVWTRFHSAACALREYFWPTQIQAFALSARGRASLLLLRPLPQVGEMPVRAISARQLQ